MGIPQWEIELNNHIYVGPGDEPEEYVPYMVAKEMMIRQSIAFKDSEREGRGHLSVIDWWHPQCWQNAPSRAILAIELARLTGADVDGLSKALKIYAETIAPPPLCPECRMRHTPGQNSLCPN